MGVSLNRPAEGTVGWFSSVDGNWKTLENQYVARQASSTSIVTVSGTTAETDLITTTIPANALGAGTTLRVYAAGSMSLPASSSPTVTFNLRWGGLTGTLLATIGWSFSTGGATTTGWVLDFKIVGTATGTSGTCETDGWSTTLDSFQSLTGAQTLDTTTSKVLVWTVTNSLTTVSTSQRVMDTDIT
jgi:hypothetical protein